MAKTTRPLPQSVGFPQIAGRNAQVLILGSMPSVASLAARQYYAHPRNAFWPIMGQLFGAGPELPYDARSHVLMMHGVAIWDVLQECTREGSLDSAILVESESANDFARFFRQHPAITHVFFNGTKAETAFRQHVRTELIAATKQLSYLRLPSTSPANAGRRFEEKLAAWQAVKQALDLAQS